MVSVYSNQFNNLKDVRCLSTDTKPTTVPVFGTSKKEQIANGSTCIEIDTGKGYLFNEAGKTWVEVPSGSTVVINPASGVSF